MKKNLNKKGFTIVELVIVIAVIGILAAVLIPTFSNVITSANKSANLSEAKSTVEAYTAFMADKGGLQDGPVFQVVDGDEVKATYVFYKGNLHEFSLTETLAEGQATAVVTGLGPSVSIGTTSYACNKSFQLKDEKGEVYKIGEEEVTFYYSDQAPVRFDDGSLKCKIYPGCIFAGVLEDNQKFAMVSANLDKATLETNYVASGVVLEGFVKTIKINFTDAITTPLNIDILVGGTKLTTEEKANIEGAFSTGNKVLTITLKADFDVKGVITIISTPSTDAAPTLAVTPVA